MSPYLLKELYQQIKRITGRRLAIIDIEGQPISGLNDHRKIKNFYLAESPSRERLSLPIGDQPNLRAVPVYMDDKLLCLVVAELSSEDAQNIQIISSLAELIIQQFLSAHRPRPDAVDLFLTRLAYRPDTIDEQELEEQMAALGYRLDIGRCALVLELTGFWSNYLQTIGAPLAEKKSLIAAKKNDIERVLSSFFTKNQDNLIGYIGNDRFLVLKDLSTTDYARFSKLLSTHFDDITGSLKNVHIKEVTAAVGSPSASPAGLLESIQESLRVLEVGVKLKGRNKVHRNDVLGVLPMIISTSIKQKREYADRLLANLDDPELQETLEAFLEHNLNLTQTSEALKVHRNTVIYRLDRIAEKIDYDPRNFEQAVELYLALQLVKIYS